MELTEVDKKQLEKDLIEVLIGALREEKLKAEQLPQIATFILDRVDKLQTQQELIDFLKELNTQWPVFSNLLTLAAGEIQEKKEEEIAEEVAVLTKEGNLDEASRLAQTVIEPQKEE